MQLLEHVQGSNVSEWKCEKCGRIYASPSKPTCECENVNYCWKGPGAVEHVTAEESAQVIMGGSLTSEQRASIVAAVKASHRGLPKIEVGTNVPYGELPIEHMIGVRARYEPQILEPRVLLQESQPTHDAREIFIRTQARALEDKLTPAQWELLKERCDAMGVTCFWMIDSFVRVQVLFEKTAVEIRNAMLAVGRDMGWGRRPHHPSLTRRKQWRRDR